MGKLTLNGHQGYGMPVFDRFSNQKTHWLRKGMASDCIWGIARQPAGGCSWSGNCYGMQAENLSLT